MKHLLFVLLIVSMASCHKDCNKPTLCDEPIIGNGDCITDSNQLKSLILGKWNWTQTQTWGLTENPCTKNLNYSYQFLNNGDVVVFKDGGYWGTSKYSFGHTWVDEISIESDSVNQTSNFHIAGGAVRLCGNYLIIDNSPVDGPMIIFVKD